MAGLTIEELLKGHTIKKGSLRFDQKVRSGWVLDSYGQPFPRKVYAAIAAVAVTEAKERITFRNLEAYTLRIVAAGGSEDYFNGEQGFSTIERNDFPAEVREMKVQLGSTNLPAAELEAVIESDLREIEAVGGLQLRMLAMSINDIARPAISHMKSRKEPPYLKPLEDARSPRTLFYALIR